MKKLVSFWVAFILFVLPLVSFAEPFTFRNGITFGMSSSEVIEKEGEEPFGKSEYVLVYLNQKSAEENCNVSYMMENDRVKAILIDFLDKHTFDNEYIDDFNKVDASLQAKYGKTDQLNQYDWENDLYKDNPEEYGSAVSCGHLTIGSYWIVNGVKISHILQGDNYGITHGILYRPIDREEAPNTEGI